MNQQMPSHGGFGVRFMFCLLIVMAVVHPAGVLVLVLLVGGCLLAIGGDENRYQKMIKAARKKEQSLVRAKVKDFKEERSRLQFGRAFAELTADEKTHVKPSVPEHQQ